MTEDDPRMDLGTVYVGVQDVDRALEFYREVFDVEPTQEEARFSTFAFDGVDFGLYDAGVDGHTFEYGDNCVPNFEVEDVDAERNRLEGLAPEFVHDGILEFGDYRTFQFVDPEGNTIEVFSFDDA